MKIGIFSDLHSNVYALDVMLSIESDVDNWICLGDFVGLFPPVNEVVNKFRLHEFIAIKGDHEEFLLSGKKMEYSFTGNDSLERQRKQITKKNEEYISTLNNALSITIDGIKMRVLHTLQSDNEQNGSKYFIDLKAVNNKFSDFDIVMFGDTHLPLISYCKDVLIINPGSSGFPIDVTGSPSYIVLDTHNFYCEIKRFQFNKKKLLADISTHGYHRKLYNFIKDGYWSK